jgi:hypothetical protein
MWLTVIHDEEYFFLVKPSVRKTIHPHPTYDDALENNSYHRKQKCVDENETWYKNSLVRKTIGQIEETNHDKETNKDRFDNRKYFFDDAGESLYGIEFLKSKNNADDSITHTGKSEEIGEIYRTIWELNTRDEVCCDTYLTRNQKSSYDDEEFERETDESEKELVTTHAKSIDEIFDFSNLDMVR